MMVIIITLITIITIMFMIMTMSITILMVFVDCIIIVIISSINRAILPFTACISDEYLKYDYFYVLPSLVL